MSTSASKKISLNLLVDKEKNRVVFVESGREFVDILFSFLALPLGTVVRLLGKNCSLGSIDALYRSVEDLDYRFLETPPCKTMLLWPQIASVAQLEALALQFDDLSNQIVYRCASWRGLCKSSSVPGVVCPCGEPMLTPCRSKNRPCSGGGCDDGVFVKGTAEFLVSDDLQVKPVSMGAGLSMLSQLGITDGGGLEKRTVELGTEEILSLLKRSLISSTPLTDVFIEEQDIVHDPTISAMTEIVRARSKPRSRTTESKRAHVKLFLSKESDKVVCAEAENDFVDLLFSFLTFPLGSIVKLLDKHSSMRCIDNLYASVELLGTDNNYMRSDDIKSMLLEPKLAPYFGCSNQLLGIDEMCICGLSSIMCNSVEAHKHTINPKLQNSTSLHGGGFTKRMVKFMVTDELVVTPLSPISGVHIVNKLMVPLSSLEEAEARIGEAEALILLKACLMSRVALNDVFSPNIFTFLQEKWFSRKVYLGPELDAMKAVADAHSKRSLKLIETALRDYRAQLEEGPILHRHLSSLCDTLLEQNLCRLIEPYSRVEITHIAEMIELGVDHVENKLWQMIGFACLMKNHQVIVKINFVFVFEKMSI